MKYILQFGINNQLTTYDCRFYVSHDEIFTIYRVEISITDKKKGLINITGKFNYQIRENEGEIFIDGFMDGGQKIEINILKIDERFADLCKMYLLRKIYERNPQRNAAFRVVQECGVSLKEMIEEKNIAEILKPLADFYKIELAEGGDSFKISV